MNQVSKSKSTIGITGATGFIGTNLCNYFNSEGIGYHPFKGNLLNNNDVLNYFQKNSIEQIVHLAGAFDPPFDNLLTKNVLITENLLSVGTKYGLKKIIFASTGAVYGEPNGRKSKEDDPTNPNTLYGLTKKMAEDCIRYYAQTSSLSYIILRFPNIYGEGNTKGVIYHFLKDINSKGVIEVAGDGTQSRNFLHVSDACSAIEKSLNYQKSNIFNISVNKKITINELTEILTNQYKLSFTVKKSPKNNNLNDLLLDTSKALKELKFSAKVKVLKI